MMKEKKKRKQCNHKHDGKIMAIGHWEPLHARLVAWARSAQTPLQEALRGWYITRCWYGPDERTRRPAFGGQIKRLSRAAFSREYGVSSSTLQRWHKEVEKISTEIKQEWT